MSIGLKPYDAGGGAIQIGGTDAIEIDSSLNVTIPQDLEVSQDLVVTGTITSQGQVIGAGPAFSAYRNAARNTGAGGWNSVIPDTEEFDTASCYDTTTGRFTPNVAGYYQINGAVYSGASTNELMAAIYKNGVTYKYGTRTASGGNGASVSSVVYFNGTTDYVELYVYYGGSSAVALTVGSTIYNYMNGVFVRPA
jgi:hypothetical protein